MPTTKEAVQDLSRRWPKAATKLVEDKANGPAVIQELRHEVAGMIEVNPEGGLPQCRVWPGLLASRRSRLRLDWALLVATGGLLASP